MFIVTFLILFSLYIYYSSSNDKQSYPGKQCWSVIMRKSGLCSWNLEHSHVLSSIFSCPKLHPYSSSRKLHGSYFSKSLLASFTDGSKLIVLIQGWGSMKDLSPLFYICPVIRNWLCGNRRSNDTDGKAILENPGDSMSKHAGKDHAGDL